MINIDDLNIANEEPIYDSHNISIASTNTKVRRLGYFKILSLFLLDGGVPSNLINRKFEIFCTRFAEYISNAKNDKGIVKQSKNGISAKPYIEVAQEFSYLNKLRNIYTSGKQFKVYQALQEKYSNSEKDIFILNEFDKLFFLESILSSDYLYFSILLKMFFQKRELEYKQLKITFQDEIIEKLKKVQKEAQIDNRSLIRNLRSLIDRINKWEKPQIYLEHILMPRLNWMLDLGILEEDSNNKYRLSQFGDKLHLTFEGWDKVNEIPVISVVGFLNRSFLKVFHESLSDKPRRNFTNDFLPDVRKYIDESFILFKTLAPNRVTASQALNYTKYRLYFENNVACDVDYIKNILIKELSSNYVFKYQEQYQDGYIQQK